jgi:peptidyl-prolyl cis-trans isomerase SurA
MNKIYNYILLFFLSLYCLSSLNAQSYLIDKIVAEVGSEYILLSDIEARIEYIKDNFGTIDDDTRCFVLQDLMAQKLLVNQAKLDSILVTDEEVNQQIDARIEQILSAMGNDVNRFEEYYGKTVDEVREEQKENLENQLYSEKMRNTIMANVEATPSEVVEFFDGIPKDSLPYFNSEVELSELVYAPKPSAEAIEEARSTLERLRERILSGEDDFARTASIYSDDPGSGEQGGDLGWQKRGTFVPEFEAAAYNLEKEEYSEVIESEFGFHLIQLLERRGNLIHTRHILIKPEIKDSDIELAKVKLDSIRTLVDSNEISFELAVKRFGKDKVQSYNNGGRLTNPQTGTTYFEIGDLESDVFFAVDDLEVGQISEPVVFNSFNEDPEIKIYKMISRSAPHQASLQTDYSKIQKYATENKRSSMFNEWLLKKVKNTYIKIDSRFAQCPEMAFWVEGGPNN